MSISFLMRPIVAGLVMILLPGGQFGAAEDTSQVPAIPDISAALPADIGAPGSDQTQRQQLSLAVPAALIDEQLPARPSISATSIPVGASVVLAMSTAEADDREAALLRQQRLDTLARWLADGRIDEAFYRRESKRLQQPAGAGDAVLTIDRSLIAQALQHQLTTAGYAVVSRLALDAVHRDERATARQGQGQAELDYLKELRAVYQGDAAAAAGTADNAWAAVASIATAQQQAALLQSNATSGLERLALMHRDTEQGKGVRDNVDILRLLKQEQVDADYLLQVSDWNWSPEHYVDVPIASLDSEGRLAGHPAMQEGGGPSTISLPIRLFSAQLHLVEVASGGIVWSARYWTSDTALWSRPPAVTFHFIGDRPAFARIAGAIRDYRDQLIKQQRQCQRSRQAALAAPDDADALRRYLGDLDILNIQLANPPAGVADAMTEGWSLEGYEVGQPGYRLGAAESFNSQVAEALIPLAAQANTGAEAEHAQP